MSNLSSKSNKSRKTQKSKPIKIVKHQSRGRKDQSYISFTSHLSKFLDVDQKNHRIILSKEMATVASNFMDASKIYHLRIAGTTTLNASGVTGTINTFQNFSDIIQLSADWSSIANLFDAVVLDTVESWLIPYSSGFNIATPQSTMVAFDDDTGFNPGSYNTVISYPNAQCFCPAVQGSTLTTEANSTGFHPIRIHYSRPFRASSTDEVTDSASAGWVKTSAISDMTGCALYYNGAVSATSNTPVYQQHFVLGARLRFVR